MHELAELILSRKGDASFDDLARRSDGAIDPKTLQKWANTRRAELSGLPTPETLKGIAAAIGVSVDMVAVAALRSAGVPVRPRFGAPAGGLDALADLLTDRQRAALAATIEAMVWPHGAPSREPIVSREAGQIVEAARVAAGLSVRDVTADVVDLSVRDWRRIVAGERGADPGTWVDMATAAGATDRLPELADLLGVALNDIG